MSKLKLAFIPGGPGFCSKPFKVMEGYLNDYELNYIDSPLLGSEVDESLNFNTIVNHTENSIKDPKNTVLVAHSFGGMIAAQMILNDDSYKGLIVLGTPFSKEAFESVGSQFLENFTDEIKKALLEFQNNPIEETMKNLVLSYKRLNFKESNIEAGNSILADGRFSVSSYRNVGAQARELTDLHKKLNEVSSIKRLYLAGKEDLIMKEDVTKTEAKDGGFDYKLIDEAAHFSFVDNPKQVSEEILNFIKTL